MSHTVINQDKLRSRRHAAVAAAFIIGAAPLAACEPTPDNQSVASASWDQGLGQAGNGQMVQGRDNCIKALMDEGKTRTEANEVCDDLARQAAQTSTSTTHHSGGGSNAMMWYLIGRNSAPTAYYGSPSTGYSYAGHYNGGGYATLTPAPRTITPTQGEILRTPPHSSARTSVISRSGFGGGAHASSGHATKMGATHRGGMVSGGHSPSGG